MGSQAFSLPSSLENGSITLLDLWDHHAKHSAEHPVFKYTSGEDNGTGSVSWGEATRAMHSAGRIIYNKLLQDSVLDMTRAHGGRPVVGILAVSDMVTAWASVTGVIRAGFTVLLLSPRNSPLALAHLLKSTKCGMIVHSTDSFVEDVLAETLGLLRESGEASTALCQLPKYSEIYGQQDVVQPVPRYQAVHSDDIAIISHTSGSTSFPKPRMISHRTFLQYSKYFYVQGIDMVGKVLAVHSLPPFHMMGAVTTIGWTAISGMVMGVFAPAVPPMPTTPQRVLDAAVSSQAEAMFIVPSFCETWSSDEEMVKKVASINLVLFSGGPLNRRVGDFLVSKGVNIRTLYGATELGGITAYPTDIPSNDWEYLKIIKQVDAHFIREEGSEDIYELLITESSDLRPCVFNETFEGRPAFAPGDLFTRHPNNSELWRIAGRKDDQIMHSNGEKTNPGPIEFIIVKHPAVGKAVMFGREQFHPGIIIEPITPLNDEKSRNAFVDEIWPCVEEANVLSPSHSRIFREMIVIADPAKPFKVTPKQSLRRSDILQDYSDEIAKAYQAFELPVSSKDIISPPNSWSEADSVAFVHAAVTHILGLDLQDDDDFFQKGVNSLEVVYLRSTIAHALHKTSVNMLLETSSVYDFPTAASLGKFISDSVTGNTADPEISDKRAKQLLALVERYTTCFPEHVGSFPVPGKETVLVTGTTGSLGINVLKTLVSLDSVEKVYAFNRKDSLGGKPVERHLSSTQLQGIDDAWLVSPKIVYLEGDITLINLGLPGDVIQELRSTLTSLLHLAWEVDFNMPLKSFIPQLQGVRNLIDLALSSELEKVPPLVFASSISDVQNLSGEDCVPPSVNENPRTAVGTGYGESKWVASRILESARDLTSLRPIVVRIGQLCGNHETGRWNAWEWFPSIVRSAKATGCLPDLQGELDWIPVDIAASTIVDLRQAGDCVSVVNLAHPFPVDAKTIIGHIARILNLAINPCSVWLENLKQVKETTINERRALEDVPALKILDFYQSLVVNSAGEMRSDGAMHMKLDVGNTVKLSKTLSNKNLRPLCGDDAAKWLQCWAVST